MQLDIIDHRSGLPANSYSVRVGNDDAIPDMQCVLYICTICLSINSCDMSRNSKYAYILIQLLSKTTEGERTKFTNSIVISPLNRYDKSYLYIVSGWMCENLEIREILKINLIDTLLCILSKIRRAQTLYMLLKKKKKNLFTYLFMEV